MRIATTNIPLDWAAQIEEIAQATGRTPRELMREALAQYLGKADPITSQLVNVITANSFQVIANLNNEVNKMSWFHSNLLRIIEYIQKLLQLLNFYTQYYSSPVPEIQQYAEAIDLKYLVQDLPRTLISLKMAIDRIDQLVHDAYNISHVDEAPAEFLTEAIAQYTGHLVQAKTPTGGELLAGLSWKLINLVNIISGNFKYVSQDVQELLQLLRLYAQYYSSPVPEIQQYAEAIESEFSEFLGEELPKVLSYLEIEVERIRLFIVGLHSFRRLGTMAINLHEEIDFIVLIREPETRSTTERKGIQVIKEYGSVPQLRGNRQQLNSVLMTVLTLAIDALEEETVSKSDSLSQILEPTLRICTQMDDTNQVVIRVGGYSIQVFFDSEQRLHAEAEPAIKSANGCGLYCYHGVILPEKYGKLPPHQWQAQWLLSENNAELRRVLIQGIGYARICTQLQATELDSWAEYSLLKIDQFIDIDREPIYLLKMNCPSTEFIHALRVPPNMRSAREAICWVNWGVDPLEFSVQT